MQPQPVARPAWAGAVASALGLGTVACTAGALWADQALRRAGAAEIDLLSSSSAPSLVAQLVAAAVGVVVATRRGGHPVGWLLLTLGAALATHQLLFSILRLGLVARPGSVPVAAYLAGPANGLFLAILALLGFVLLLTPTGSLPSARWRWWARAVVAATGIGAVAQSLHPQPLFPEHPTVGNPLAAPQALLPLVNVTIGLAAAVIAVALLVGAGSLVLRFRRARGVERQQLRWLAFAAAVSVVAVVVAAAASGPYALEAGFGVAVVALPLATGGAVLRYRLYDLDRIVSRTLSYGVVTVLLGGTYAALTLLLGQLLGRGSSLAVAVATLAVAAAFQPTRRRVQQAVDRRFNRARYDAGRTIEAFSARLQQQIDLDTMTSELLTVVDATMQPTRVSLWLRPQAPPA